MATMAELDKAAAKIMHAKMRRMGFAVEKKLYFWRKRGPLFDTIWSDILSSRGLLRVYVSIICPWVDNENGEFEKFPIAECLLGGTLSPDFPEIMHGHLFDIWNEQQIEETLKEVLHLVETKAIPWFDSFNTADKLVRRVSGVRVGATKEAKAKFVKGILLGFEKEPICTCGSLAGTNTSIPNQAPKSDL